MLLVSDTPLGFMMVNVLHEVCARLFYLQVYTYLGRSSLLKENIQENMQTSGISVSITKAFYSLETALKFSSFLFRRALEVIIGTNLILALIQQWMIPSVVNSLIPFSVSKTVLSI